MDNLHMEFAKRLYLRFYSLYGDKFVKNTHTPDFIDMWYEDWAEALKGVAPEFIKTAIDHCRNNLEWPPSIAEFKRLCEEASGIPSFEDSFRLAVRKEFTHPIIAAAYLEIGAWDFSHGKETELRVRFKRAYQNALCEYRASPDKSQLKLEQIVGVSMPLLPLPVSDAKIAKAVSPTSWPDEAKNPRHKKFDSAAFEERKKHLMGMDEQTASILDSADWYDRVRFLRQAQSDAIMERNERLSPSSKPDMRKRQGRSGHVVNFTDWAK